MAQDIGIVGIGVMGRNIALNLDENGLTVAVYDIETSRLQSLHSASDGRIATFGELTLFISSLSRPRKIWLMVRAGKLVDELINQIKPHLEEDDIIIDGGNSHFKDTARRVTELSQLGIDFVGMGVSGGSEGARYGPSLMPGGSATAWSHIAPILKKIAPKTSEGVSCVRWIGESGAGHLVKTVHNGIEYADMELIAEAYHILRSIGMENQMIGKTFQRWNSAKLSSYLLEISASIMATKEAGEHLIDLILDKAGQKGTGSWTVQIALEYGIPVPLIFAAVNQRIISSFKERRVKLAKSFTLSGESTHNLELTDLENAMYVAKILAHEQGLNVISAVSSENSWGISITDVLAVWRKGCIVRSALVDRLLASLDEVGSNDILGMKTFQQELIEGWGSLRKIINWGIASNIPLPAFTSAFQYLSSLTSEFLPANMIQAQRDYFGSHGFHKLGDVSTLSHGNWL